MEVAKLASAIKRGDRRALAQGITIIENGDFGANDLVRLAKPPMHAFILGITGPPGTGKSTLVDRLTRAYRKRGLKVGVLAVDPSSPVTGGALLGDRIRMSSSSGDRGVYIRSMASRGWSGGLSKAASLAIRLMDAAGFDIIFVETVGIGQADVEVVGLSHAAIVLLMPGQGDDVQVSKAGLMEVGDIFVVNKSDLEGADSLVVSLLGVVRGRKGRSPPIIKVSALSGEGIEPLVSAVERIRNEYNSRGNALRVRSIKGMIIETAKGDLLQSLGRLSDMMASELSAEVLSGTLTVEQAAAELQGGLTYPKGGDMKGRKAPHRSRRA